MELNQTLYAVESEKSVSHFVEDLTAIAEQNDFVINICLRLETRIRRILNRNPIPETASIRRMLCGSY